MLAILLLAAPLLDMRTKQMVIAAAEQHLRNEYVLPEVGEKLAAELERKLNSGAYDAIGNGEEFASRLTADLQSASHDKHLRVTYSAEPQRKSAQHEPTAEERLRIAQLGGQVNYGWRKAEILPGNVGLLAIDGFWHLDFGGGDTATAAMAFVANSEALIIDLRESSAGGDPEMSRLITSYFFAAPVHVNDFYSRPTGETRQWWTLPYVPGARYGKALFVLTSGKTFSAGEGFAYDLQSLKRAVIVGATTAGAAHPEEEYALDENFTIELPFARSINVVTKTDWEGTGVRPDIAIDPAKALDKAYEEALQLLIKASSSRRVTEERIKALADVQQRLQH